MAVVASLVLFGIDKTNITISIVTLLMLFILQNTQNRDSAALHVKLDDVITHSHGPRDEVAGIGSKTDEQIRSFEASPSEPGLFASGQIVIPPWTTPEVAERQDPRSPQGCLN